MCVQKSKPCLLSSEVKGGNFEPTALAGGSGDWLESGLANCQSQGHLFTKESIVSVHVRVLRMTGLALSAACLLCSLAQAEEPNPERNAYFGETHVHTSWSLDRKSVV